MQLENPIAFSVENILTCKRWYFVKDDLEELDGSPRFIVYLSLIQSQAWESLRENPLNACEVYMKSQYRP